MSWKRDKYRHSLAAKGIKTFKTKEQFMKYHNTGYIPSGTYDNYSTIEGISWLGTKEEYPILNTIFIDKTGEKIEFRQSGEKNDYVKLDKKGEIIRDKNGLAIMQSKEEKIKNNLPLYDTTIVAFNSDNKPIGWVSDEFGATGVWVITDYQRRGIGMELIHEFSKQFKRDRILGQMTPEGYGFSEKYFYKYGKE